MKLRKRPWFVKNPAALHEIEADLRQHYPTLHPVPRVIDVLIQGGFPVSHHGRELDLFRVQIRLPYDYPQSLPSVLETGGRIPRTPDAHKYEGTDVCCVFLPDARFREWPPGSSFLEFLQGPLNHYFLGQACRERTGGWPWGEWKHDAQAFVDFYAEELGIEDERLVLSFMRALSHPGLKGHWDCPCGSGRPIRRCHIALLALRGNVEPERVAASCKKVERLLRHRAERQVVSLPDEATDPG